MQRWSAPNERRLLTCARRRTGKASPGLPSACNQGQAVQCRHKLILTPCIMQSVPPYGCIRTKLRQMHATVGLTTHGAVLSVPVGHWDSNYCYRYYHRDCYCQCQCQPLIMQCHAFPLRQALKSYWINASQAFTSRHQARLLRHSIVSE